MENLKNKKVGAIVAKNYRTAKVLTAFGIDFCCRGGITLDEACQNEGVSLDELLPALREAYEKPDEENFKEMLPRDLIKHIVSVHHSYIDETGPVLLGYLRKIERVHGDRHPELHEVRAEFEEALDQLSAHMEKEETILFPFIERIEAAEETSSPLQPGPGPANVEAPIRMMEDEHEVEGERFRKISGLTSGYEPPRDACQTYRVSFQLLQEFENDLHRHIHLENNILFKQAKEMYSDVASPVG